MIWTGLALSWKPRQRRAAILLSMAALVAASCAHQPVPDAYNPPGFFMGLLHGFIILFSFVVGLFTDCRIYAFPNSGGWYDFGYLIGAGIFLGGSGASSS
jgi:hypothetical protein